MCMLHNLYTHIIIQLYKIWIERRGKMRNIFKMLLLASLLLSTFVFAGFESALKKQKFLSPDEAFQVTAVMKDDAIETKLIIADSIHVYEDSLKYDEKLNEIETVYRCPTCKYKIVIWKKNDDASKNRKVFK